MASRLREGQTTSNGAADNWRAPPGLALAMPGVVLVYAGHLLYGGLTPNTALSLCLFSALMLLTYAAAPATRRDLGRVAGLTAPGVLWLIACLFAILSLTPYGIGGPAPIWNYVGASPAAITLNKTATTLEIIKLISLAAVFLIGAATGVSDDRARTATNVFVLGGGLFALWAIVAHAAGGNGHATNRLEANFLAPNTAGGFFALLSVVALGPLTSALRTQRRDRIVRSAPYFAAVASALVALLMTGSRGGAASAMVGFVVYLLLQVFAGRIKIGRALIGAGIGGAAVLVAILLAGNLMIDRAMEGAATAEARAHLATEHWRAYMAAPWMGYGLGTFEAVNRSITDLGNFQDLWNVRALHNIYLQWLEEAGVLGAAPVFAALGLILVMTFRRALARSRMTSLLFALLAADAAVLFHAISDFDLNTHSFAANWAFLLGLQFSLAQGSRFK